MQRSQGRDTVEPLNPPAATKYPKIRAKRRRETSPDPTTHRPRTLPRPILSRFPHKKNQNKSPKTGHYRTKHLSPTATQTRGRPDFQRAMLLVWSAQKTPLCLRPIAGKVLAGERLSFDDGLTLYRSGDLLGVGCLANHVRERLNGNITYFNVNRHINPTNVCVAACKLCAFGRGVRDPKGYTMSLEQVWETAGQGYIEEVSEFHIVGGLHPELSLDWFCEMIRGLRERYPRVHLKAFTMVEIGYLARRAKISIEDTLRKLKDAGVDSLPGGGAEIFAEPVRRIICDHKIDGQEWLDTARLAHKMGLKSNATMLYGHVETGEDRVDHLIKLRELQDETGGFQTFIPLAFHPANTALHHLPPTSGFDDIKTIAVARLLLDNFPHIKAF